MLAASLAKQKGYDQVLWKIQIEDKWPAGSGYDECFFHY